jgi:hypothetical protein
MQPLSTKLRLVESGAGETNFEKPPFYGGYTLSDRIGGHQKAKLLCPFGVLAI